MTESKDLKILEAILFASTEPIIEKDLKDKINDKNNIKLLLEKLRHFYSDRGVVLKKTGETWSFKTSPELSEELTILKKQKRKLSRAALETLAIIAYHQPITRAEIEDIRGVQMGRGSIDHLMEIGWIKPKGRKQTPGRPTTWGTTDIFLEHFDLENIENLPNKNELKNSGFLEKKSAISTITDLAKDQEFVELNDGVINEDEEELEDFINQKE